MNQFDILPLLPTNQYQYLSNENKHEKQMIFFTNQYISINRKNKVEIELFV